MDEWARTPRREVVVAMVIPSQSQNDPVVITGIGLICANGFGREAVWEATRNGTTGIRHVTDDDNLPPPLKLAAPVDVPLEFPSQLKVIRLARFAAEEAIFDANVNLQDIDSDRFACAVSGHMSDVYWWDPKSNSTDRFAGRYFNSEQWLPNSACWDLATRFGLTGPRFAHSTACASGLIDVLTATDAIRSGKCDIALAGSSEAIDPVFAAGFSKMRVLADGSDPHASCMPFDVRRKGFVMGEGAGMFVIERLSHALARGAKVYCEILSGKMLAEAHHVTSLSDATEGIVRLIDDALRKADVGKQDVGYINAHGTGTEQNDLLESTGIRAAFGKHADDLCVSSLKSVLGHLVNASGTVELALSVLGMRDGYAPPTMALEQQDPACDLDFVPRSMRASRFQCAMKLSLAFGGHLVAAVVRRWTDAASGYAYPSLPLRRAA